MQNSVFLRVSVNFGLWIWFESAGPTSLESVLLESIGTVACWYFLWNPLPLRVNPGCYFRRRNFLLHGVGSFRTMKSVMIPDGNACHLKKTDDSNKMVVGPKLYG